MWLTRVRALLLVIPGRREAASPESITTIGDYGFRAPSLRSGPGMTGEILGVDRAERGGLFTVNSPDRNSNDRQDIPALRGRGAHLRHLGGGGRIPLRPAGAA